MKEKIPQNIVEVIKDIGENIVLFHLFAITKNTNWSVYKNYDQKGYDLLLLNNNKNKKINNKIELK